MTYQHVIKIMKTYEMGSTKFSLFSKTIRNIIRKYFPGPFVSLKCSASGSPTPQIQWKLDGFQLPQNDR
jgi:hypothetical protein